MGLGPVINRRQVLCGTAMAIGWGMPTVHAGSAGLPQRPVRIIVPFSAGTTLDVMARALSAALEPVIGQRPPVVNRDGAAGFIALSEMAQAEADGTTWLFSGPGQFTIQPHIRRRVAFTLDDFSPVCQLYETPFAVVASRRSPATTFAEFLDRARSEPGRIRFGHYGPGSATHLLMVILARQYGLTFLDIPYRSQGQLVQDLLTGELEAAVLAPGSYEPDIVRHLVILGTHRYTEQPDIPTIVEMGQPPPLASFAGIYVMKGVPEPVRAAIEAACLAAAADPVFRGAAGRARVEAAPLPAGPFKDRILAQSREVQALVAEIGLRID
ncbi:tripartite tricarboxylate transporter substrate binding protein [Phreatobacter sp.]|uniref:Bug family tripartite tricarboxylate transporter substrate binding protein n=1 Tax=Phreatobacter sp. TaxID=1966341 RepID=UPI0022C66347|nr:tripartite tricarboxylate transporter substrate binding protein [Phreatobacter sp.]MCZ8313647.1 tripartite tricarboxylate transporter substrate binding protein [Phreatobacter sp.]